MSMQQHEQQQMDFEGSTPFHGQRHLAHAASKVLMHL